jgi:hypothetical protein
MNDLDIEKSAVPFNKVFFETPSNALDVLNLSRLHYQDGEYTECADLLKVYSV